MSAILTDEVRKRMYKLLCCWKKWLSEYNYYVKGNALLFCYVGNLLFSSSYDIFFSGFL